MLKHPILIAILLIALAASGCVAGQPVSPEQMAAVAPTVVDMVSQIAPQLAGTYSVAASDGAGNTRELSLKLTPDGNVELVTELADATQLMESGTWLLSGQGDVVVTLGTTEGQSIVEPRTIRLAVEGDGLVATDSVTGSTLRFSPGMLAAAPAVDSIVGDVMDVVDEPASQRQEPQRGQWALVVARFHHVGRQLLAHKLVKCRCLAGNVRRRAEHRSARRRRKTGTL